MPNPPRTHRRWFRINMRGLMLLVLLAGGGVGWLVHTIRSERAAIAAVEAAGGDVQFDYQRATDPATGGFRTEPAAPRWVRRLLGDELFESVRAIHFARLATPGILDQVARFDGLETLEFVDDSPAGLGYEALQGLRSLRKLAVLGTGVTDASLREIAGIRSLRDLKLFAGGSATAAGLVPLGSLPELTDLWLYVDGRRDAGYARVLAGLPRLQNLIIEARSRPVPATLAAIARDHPALQTLRVVLADATDADLAGVGTLTRLQQLVLFEGQISPAGLTRLRSLGSLTNLDLQRTPLTDAGLEIVAGLDALEILHLGASPALTDAGVAHLARLPRLQELGLVGTGVTDSGMAALARSSTLRVLMLADNPGVTDASLTPDRLGPKLEHLNLGGASTTDDGVARLRLARPRLNITFFH